MDTAAPSIAEAAEPALCAAAALGGAPGALATSELARGLTHLAAALAARSRLEACPDTAAALIDAARGLAIDVAMAARTASHRGVTGTDALYDAGFALARFCVEEQDRLRHRSCDAAPSPVTPH